MVHFCEAVVEEIKLAGDAKAIEEIVNNSYVNFRATSKSGKEGSYTLNMIVTLLAAKARASSDHEYKNFEEAILIYRVYQQRQRSPVI